MVDADDDNRTESGEGFFAWATRQEQTLFAQIDELAKRDELVRDYEAYRARLCWDEDRLHDAEVSALQLRRRPAATRSKLARSRHGALWLIGRWEALGAIAQRDGAWTEAQESLAYDLMGVDHDLRSGTPWVAAGLDSPRSLVEREIRGLSLSIERTLTRIDEIERLGAKGCCPVQDPPTLKAVRRESAACWKRLMTIQKRMVLETERPSGTPLSIDPPRPVEVAPPPPEPATIPPPRTAPASRAAMPTAPTPGVRTLAATLAPAPEPPVNRKTRRAALRLQRRSR